MREVLSTSICARSRLQAVALQGGGDAVGQRVEFGIGQRAAAIDDRDMPGPLCGVQADAVREVADRLRQKFCDAHRKVLSPFGVAIDRSGGPPSRANLSS